MFGGKVGGVRGVSRGGFQVDQITSPQYIIVSRVSTFMDMTWECGCWDRGGGAERERERVKEWEERRETGGRREGKQVGGEKGNRWEERRETGGRREGKHVGR